MCCARLRAEPRGLYRTNPATRGIERCKAVGLLKSRVTHTQGVIDMARKHTKSTKRSHKRSAKRSSKRA